MSKQGGTSSKAKELSNQDGEKGDKLSIHGEAKGDKLSIHGGAKGDNLSSSEGKEPSTHGGAELSKEDVAEAMLEKLSMINLNVEKLVKINEEVRSQSRVPPERSQSPVPPEPPLIYSLLGEDMNPDNSRIYRAAIRDDWNSVEADFRNDKEKLKVELSPLGDTALHIAVGTNSSHTFVGKIVDKLIEKFDKQVLRIKNRVGDTALHIAARVGNLKAAKLLVFHDPQLLEVTNTKGRMPIWQAAWGNDLETLHYLLSVSLKEDVELQKNGFCSEPQDDSKFLYVCMKSGHYDVALYLIKRYPQLVWENCGQKGTPLLTLANRPDSFCSGMCLRYTEYYWFYKFIYNCIPISVDDESLSFKMPDTTEVVPRAAVPVWKVHFNNLTRRTVVPLREAYSSIILLLMVTSLRPRGSFLSLLEGASRYLLRILSFLPSVCYLILVYPIVYLAKKVKCIIKEVHDEKLKHRRAELLVAEICSTLLEKPPADNINVYDVLRGAVYRAIKNGCIELLEKCIEEYPGTIWCTQPDYSFCALAIKHRQEKVFNLIYQMSAYKIHMLNHRDNLQNALHAAGELPPYNRLNTVTGPALQLQRELLWFQKVEEFSETSSLHFRNKKRMTPKRLFAEQHRDLLRDAQEWTKGTTASSTVVGALIVTITFAAIFTAPGGYEDGDKNKGTPVFLGRKLFQIFVFTDTAALFFSATSVLSFLSTLTCLSQEDFLSAVPWRLTIGFFSLYLSLVATVVAFGATLVLVLESEFHWIKTMVITVGCLPIMLNSWWQFPLFLELLRGTVWLTFGKSIFHKQKDLLIH